MADEECSEAVGQHTAQPHDSIPVHIVNGIDCVRNGEADEAGRAGLDQALSWIGQQAAKERNE